MSDKPIEIKIDNKDVDRKLLELAQKSENLRPLMKNIAGIFASATEENFKNEGRPDKWTELSEITKKTKNETEKMAGTNTASFRSTCLFNFNTV